MSNAVIRYVPIKALTSKLYRRLTLLAPQATPGAMRLPEADAVTPEMDGDKGGVKSVPHGVEQENGAPSPNDVDVPAVDGGAGRPIKTGDLSPGKESLRDEEVSSVANYASEISANWKRSVDALMNIARLCAEASARLTARQKSELMARLPFGEVTFSKFVQIGADTRLHTPEIQRLLPPHYTTMYAVTSLRDEELKQAVAEKVLRPDVKREELQRWRRAQRRNAEPAPDAKETTGDTVISSAPNRTTQDFAEGDALPPAISRDDTQETSGAQEDLPLVVQRVPIEAIASPTTPTAGEDIPAFLDRRPLSPEDQLAYDDIKVAWERHLQPLWNSASTVVQERIDGEVIWAKTSSRSPSAMLSQPTTGGLSAHTSPDDTDAGIENRGIQMPGSMRKSRRPKKMQGPFENSPFWARSVTWVIPMKLARASALVHPGADAFLSNVTCKAQSTKNPTL